MSESERSSRSGSGNNRRCTVVIRRDDHFGDAIGLAFLEEPETRGDAILSRLGDYLGPRVKIVRAEVSRAQIEAEVEIRGWSEEAARLAVMARDLLSKGARKGAIGLCREGLRLDPLNVDALKILGAALSARGEHELALDALRRAREAGGEHLDVLLALGQSAMELDRRPSAISYLRAALELDSQNFVARRALAQLGYESASAVDRQFDGAKRRD